MAKSEVGAAKQRREERRKARLAEESQSNNGKPPAGSPAKPQKSKIREWTDALLFALIAALIIRAFFFEAFRIPTPSMERNLLVGDFLLVSKLHYGPRTPITLGIPFTDIYLRSVELPAFRLPGFTNISHGDVVVFNYPKETEAIDRKTHYIKRVMGMPGDSLRIDNKVLFTNDTEHPLMDGMQQLWRVYKQEGPILPYARLRELGIRPNEITVRDNTRIDIMTTEAAIEEIATWPYVERVEPIIDRDGARAHDIFPPNSGYTPDQYGPLFVPARGATVTLSDENWFAYEEVITRYEGRSARALGRNTFEIDGVETSEYTFAQDYYFMVGDNRDNSLDSRFWGFVPDDHIVGKALVIYFSWDSEEGLPRLGRILSFIR